MTISVKSYAFVRKQEFAALLRPKGWVPAVELAQKKVSSKNSSFCALLSKKKPV